MVPETDEQARRDAEQLQRQAQWMEQRRPQIEASTRSALRRVLIVIVVFAVAIWLWRSAG